MKNIELEEKLKLLPRKPGCYLMKDDQGTIIYVGKAKNLNKRVKSYFNGAHNIKTTKLVSKIKTFDYIITNNEVESLILESNLIKKHLPKYNIRLIDDKTYPYIKIETPKFPKLTVFRTTHLTNQKDVFGPFPSFKSAKNTVELLNEIYPLRICNHKTSNSSCLYYHIGRCGYDSVKKDNINYNKILNEIRRFFKGDNKIIIVKIKEKIELASTNLNYEVANRYKLILDDIKETSKRQLINLNDYKDRDFITYAYNDNLVSINILVMRRGSIIDNKKIVTGYINTPIETVYSYTDQLYLDNKYVDELLFSNNFNIEDIKIRYNNKGYIPKKGDKKKIIDLSLKNATEALNNYNILYKHKTDLLLDKDEELEKLFGKTFNYIEAFDNAQINNKAAISSLIVYKNNIFRKDLYRKYNHNDLVKQDDYKAISNVVYRRYYKLLLENRKLPDLILVDGGKGQVSCTKKVLNSLNLDILVIGLKKNDFHKLESLIYENKEIKLDKSNILYKFFGSISEEVHRYSINHHRKVFSKENFKSPLDNIKGLGAKRKNLLLKNFNSIENIKNADVKDFIKIGIPKKLSYEIKEYFK